MKAGKESGSVELVVLGLLAALICVLAFPLMSSVIDNGKTKPAHHQQQVQQFYYRASQADL